MRSLLIIFPILLILLWGIMPLMLAVSVTVLALNLAAVIWLVLALTVSVVLFFLLGWHSGSIISRRSLVFAALVLLVCITPSLISRRPLITLRAQSPLSLLWLILALIGTALTLALIGKRFRCFHQEQQAHEQLMAVVRDQLSEGIALYTPRLRMWWANAADHALLNSRRDELRHLLQRAADTKRIAAQSFVINENLRVNVQAVPLKDGSISVLTRPLENDSSQFYERFIRRLVHDMRNPLAAIIAHASNLQHNPGLPEASTARTIEHEAQRLTRLVDSMLFDARLSYVPLALETLDLSDVVEEVYFQHDERAMREGISFEMETPSQSAQFHGDHDLLVRALSNLVDNSLKYCQVGATVTVSLIAGDNDYVIKVVDTGEGIPPEFLPDRIFEALVRARPRESGSGLGLSIVKKIVEMHGGQITAESIVGKGTTMTIWLPK